MKNALLTLGVGILIWLVPFALGFAILPVVHMHHPVFDTLMALAMIAGTTTLSLWYLKRTGFHENGVLALVGIGSIWVVIAIAVDVPIMIHGPVGMSVHEYMSDIGLMYLGIPMMLVAIGVAMRRNLG